MAAPDKIDDIPITPSSGNVFADLGFPNAEEELFKADLVRQIIRRGQFSIRINQEWRVCFEWPDDHERPFNIEIADYH